LKEKINQAESIYTLKSDPSLLGTTTQAPGKEPSMKGTPRICTAFGKGFLLMKRCIDSLIFYIDKGYP
jgi:hypothetical protein